MYPWKKNKETLDTPNAQEIKALGQLIKSCKLGYILV